MSEDRLVNRTKAPYQQSPELKVVESKQRKVWANGHRFGPSLICQAPGCIQTWLTQQDHPTQCGIREEGMAGYWQDQAQEQRKAYLEKEGEGG